MDVDMQEDTPVHTDSSLSVLVAASDPESFAFSCSIVDRLCRTSNVDLSVVACDDFPAESDPALPPDLEFVWKRYDSNGILESPYLNSIVGDDFAEVHVANYRTWADLLVLAPFDAEHIARMLHGFTSNVPLQLLRSWDISKRIILIPAMSDIMWENPMSKKQLGKIRRKWNWIRVLPPLLWTLDHEQNRKYLPWEGDIAFDESIQTQIDLRAVGGRTVALPAARMPTLTHDKSKWPCLPPELWSMILEFTDDWELATTLKIVTNLPVPEEWRQSGSEEGPKTQMQKLEWTLLTGTHADIRTLLDADKPTRISRLCIELTMRFGMVHVLAHLEHAHKDIFWGTFGHTFLPHKASMFGKTEILEYWRTSPTFVTKEYTAEAMDNASRSGCTQALDWWYESGLPLKYTESSLEAASSQGYIQVLSWWKEHSKYRTASIAPPGDHSVDQTEKRGPLNLKVGKSITYATQSGCLPAIQFWVESGIPFSHEDTVAKLASAHGHTRILDYWRKLRGEKMLFDRQVLVGPTKMGHVDVLEWWKRSGLRVEYKTCDIEEALEDGMEGETGILVSKWWAANGLNLGMDTSEWTKVKVLGS